MATRKSQAAKRNIRVFFSYSHKNKAWKDRVVTHLTPFVHRGDIVLWDDRKIGTGDDWYPAIKKQIDQADVAICLISPEYLASDFVNKEEIPALNRRRQEEGMLLIPVLIEPCAWQQVTWLSQIQIFPTPPKPLSELRADQRERALAKLATLVAELANDVHTLTPGLPTQPSAEQEARVATSPGGVLEGVPDLPPHFVGRERELTRLKQMLLTGSAAIGVTAVRGSGGVGKTVLAAAAARDPETQAAFPDGIYWLQVHSDRKPLQLLSELARQLSGKQVTLSSLDDAQAVLGKLLSGRRVLVILDDIANTDLAGLLTGVVLPPSRLLFTTRSREVLEAVGADVFDLDVLHSDEALSLLAQFSGVRDPAELPREAAEVAKECGYQPLALALIGAMVRERPPGSPIALGTLREEDLESARRTFPDYPYPQLFRVIAGAIEGLPEAERERLLDLAGFDENVAIPIPAIASVWKTDEATTEGLLDRLQARQLITFDRSINAVRIHDLIRQYLRGQRPGAPRLVVDEILKSNELLIDISSDASLGPDQLGIADEVKAFSAVVSSKDLEPPLCLGIFGDWGTGKTFFLAKMQERIELLSKASLKAAQNGQSCAFCSHVAQITFNAWHYVDANLWASLACRIFEGLDDCITRLAKKAEADPEETKAQLFRELSTAREQRDRAKRDKDSAEEELKKAESALAGLQKDREQKSVDLQQLKEATVQQALDNSPEIKKNLEEAAGQLGLTHLADNVADLQRTLQDLRTLQGQFKGIWLAFMHTPDRWWRVGILVLLIVAVPLVGVGTTKLVSYLSDSDAVAKAAAVLGQVAAFIALLSMWLNKTLSWGSAALKRLEAAGKQADGIMQKARQQPSADEERAAKELIALREKESAAKRALFQAQEGVKEAEKKLKEIENATDGRALAEFIQERVRSSAYQSQLGIISTIRRDFQSLSDLLTKSKNSQGTSETLPRVDRIVLYIDDLDRCPESRVVEVLQAVHLLLYFKLFIVVIAVDSRWLLRSLQKQYFALQRGERDARAGLVDNSVLWSSTPQNYLEKIIQIPFNLRAMESRGFQRLITSLVPHIEADGDRNVDQEEAPAAPTTQQAAAEARVSEPTTPSEEPAPPAAGAPAPILAAAKVSIQAEEVDLAPESLKLTKRELDFVEKLSELAHTPRSAKRLVNIYRLIRASVRAYELPRFLGKDGSPADYEVVLCLLAAQIGFPLAATDLFARMMACGEADSYGDFGRDLGKASELPESPSVGHDEKALRRCIDLMPAAPNRPMHDFKKWIPKVSRYSFRGAE